MKTVPKNQHKKIEYSGFSVIGLLAVIAEKEASLSAQGERMNSQDQQPQVQSQQLRSHVQQIQPHLKTIKSHE